MPLDGHHGAQTALKKSKFRDFRQNYPNLFPKVFRGVYSKTVFLGISGIFRQKPTFFDNSLEKVLSVLENDLTTKTLESAVWGGRKWRFS